MTQVKKSRAARIALKLAGRIRKIILKGGLANLTTEELATIRAGAQEEIVLINRMISILGGEVDG